jgi:hypothetical protein
LRKKILGYLQKSKSLIECLVLAALSKKATFFFPDFIKPHKNCQKYLLCYRRKSLASLATSCKLKNGQKKVIYQTEPER